MEKELPAITTAELTDREREILKLLATGSSNKEIARDLFISSNTVKVHLRNIFAKIGAASRTEAAMYAVHSGLVKSQAIPEPTVGPVIGTATSDAPAPSRRFFRMANVAIVLTILVIVAITGVLLARQRANLGTNTYPPTPTMESRWQTLADLPVARTGFAATAYENQIFVFGGETSQGITGITERFDPSTDAWTELSPKPTAVSDANAAAVGGRIYVPGGKTAFGVITDVLEIYDPQLNRWSQGPSLPFALSGYAMASLEGRLFLFGGQNMEHDCLNTVLIFDPDNDSWTEGTPMPTARSFAGAAVTSDGIFVMGGYDGKNALDALEVYKPQLEADKKPWEEADPIPSKRYTMGITSIADAVYMLGGKGVENIKQAPALYIVRINKWQSFEAPSSEIGDDVKLVPLGEYIYVLGGMTAGGSNGYTLRYQALYMIEIPLVP
jgi:DNA-binding CsgD family transcriptional regulator